MIQPTTLYKTQDGQCHTTEKRAVEHSLGLLRKMLDRRIISCSTRSEQFKVIEDIISDDPKDVVEFINKLADIVNYGEDYED